MDYSTLFRFFADILSITTSFLYIWSLAMVTRTNRHLYHNLEYAFGHPVESDSDYEYNSDSDSDSDYESSESDSDSDDGSSDSESETHEVEEVDPDMSQHNDVESDSDDSGFEDEEEKPLIDPSTRAGILMNSSGMWGNTDGNSFTPIGSIFTLQTTDSVPDLVDM